MLYPGKASINKNNKNLKNKTLYLIFQLHL